MASLDFELEKKEFIEFYDSHWQKLDDFVKKVIDTLKDLVKELPESDGFMVFGRVKEKNECIEKFIRKYKSNFEAENQVYTIKDSISDLLGFRIVCIYINQVEAVKKALINEFEKLEETNKINQIQSTENIFGYQALHMDMKLSQPYLNIAYYRQFHDIKFEIQIRTIIQDSWSVVDHKIKYKREIPLALKRKINVLSALFELADREFMAIKDENTLFIEAAEKKVSNDILQKTITTLSLDLVSFTGFLRSKYPDTYLKSEAVKRFFYELKATNAALNLADLVSLYDSCHELVLQFQSESQLTFNVFTFIRHALYLADQTIYASLLRDYQVVKLSLWLTNKKPPPL